MAIQILDPKVASQIAAGEIVERPASALKELIENALDSGASTVDIEVTRGGLDFIHVIDNGSGISSTDTKRLFQRHATSKLSSADELGEIRTLGFRGEALYSIGAVSSVSLKTKVERAQSGTILEIRNGNFTRYGPVGTPDGTSVTVKNLFEGLPARREFLGSERSELNRIQTLVSGYILAYPHLTLSLTSERRLIMRSLGHGNLIDAAITVYGPEIADNLLTIHGVNEALNVEGLISPPALSRSTRSFISISVNGRPIHNRNLTHAITEAYRSLLPGGRFPIVIARISVDPKDVDVNVHPAKTEVRFKHERILYGTLQRMVRGVLLSESPIAAFEHIKAPQSNSETAHRGANLESPSRTSGSWQLAASHKDTPYPTQSHFTILPTLRVVGQVRRTYIVAEGSDGIYLIDQHAAHECVIYERLRDQSSAGKLAQALLDPVVLELTATQESTVNELFTNLNRFGWTVEPFGSNTVLIRAIPSTLKSPDPKTAFIDLLEEFQVETRLSSGEQRLAATVACHSSIRAGMALSPDEMAEMIRLLEQIGKPQTCPHGRPTMISLRIDSLERAFLRS
jgi:DNA mismatch repair protein MutL